MFLRSLLLGAMIVAAISAAPLAATPWTLTSGSDKLAQPWPLFSENEAAVIRPFPYFDEPSLIPGEMPPYHADKQKAVALGPFPLFQEVNGGRHENAVPLGPFPLFHDDRLANEPSLIPGEVPPYHAKKKAAAFGQFPLFKEVKKGHENAVPLGPFPLFPRDSLANEPSLIPSELTPYHASKRVAPIGPFSFVSDFSTGQDPMEPKPNPTFPEIDDPSADNVALGPFPLFPQDY